MTANPIVVMFYNTETSMAHFWLAGFVFAALMALVLMLIFHELAKSAGQFTTF